LNAVTVEGAAELPGGVLPLDIDQKHSAPLREKEGVVHHLRSNIESLNLMLRYIRWGRSKMVRIILIVEAEGGREEALADWLCSNRDGCTT
jgi:hypothetical protein